MSVPTRLAPLPLWEERWNRQALIDRSTRAPRGFKRGFQMKAFTDDEATFPSFEKCRLPGARVAELRKNNWPAFTGVDLSGKKRPGNAIVTVKVDPVRRYRYPIDVRYGKWKSSQLCEVLQEVDNLYHPIVMMVEDNGYQESLIDWVGAQKDKFTFWMKVEGTTTTGGNKADPDIGLPGMEVEFAAGAWIIPYGEYEGTEGSPIITGDGDEEEQQGTHSEWQVRQWARWDYEFRHHPMASTSDGVMATWFARQGIELNMGLYMSGR